MRPAQLGIVDETKADSGLAENVFLPADRSILQQLARARELIARTRYGEAVRYLASILDGPEDYFFQPDRNVPVHRSLKGEAQRLIGALPHKGRELYRLQSGPKARQMLSEAIAHGDIARLAEVSRRFFHTSAGYEATLLLGLHHLDHSRPLAGALMLERLQNAIDSDDHFDPTLSLAMATGWLKAGKPEKARAILVRLKHQSKDGTVVLAGQRVELFATDNEALSWLIRLAGPQQPDQLAEAELWTMVGGNPARNATSFGDAPLLNMRWSVPVANDSPLLRTLLAQLQHDTLQQCIPPVSAFRPLAVDDMILMRTACNLVAVDFASGKREWQVAIEDELETVLQNFEKTGSTVLLQQLAGWLQERIWNDATYGTLSSDGRHVFTIEGLAVGVNPSSFSRRVMLPGNASPHSVPKSYNRLVAHNIRTGKLKWHLGGASGRHGPRMAETFFLGPPLPLMGRLYVLAETKGEIRLLVLDADSGNLVWSQHLVIAEQDVLRDPLRRVAGLSPSYADGTLICPTSAGAVVAVDLATRSLLWGYRYRRPSASVARTKRLLMQMRFGGYADPSFAGRWLNANAILADGHVLITPLESDALHCLNLRDGKLLWTLERQDDLYVACVHRGKVILVGRHAVRAVSLTETSQQTRMVETVDRNATAEKVVETQVTVTVPTPAWDGRTVELPEGSMPSGQGFLNDDRYFLPIDSAEVVAVDLERGAITHVSKSREGVAPGNLICYKDRVISQGCEGLDVFYELESARHEADRLLAAGADTAEALALRGEIFFDEGKHCAAVASLRQAYELDADTRTQDLLRDAMLDGLRNDFTTHSDSFAEVKQLLDEPRQRARYLRLMASGFHRDGRSPMALQYYLKLIDMDDAPCLESISRTHWVRRDRWAQVHLSQLHDHAEVPARKLIDEAVESRLQAAINTAGLDSLRQFLVYFGNHPRAEAARHELVSRLVGSGEALEAEMAIWTQWQSSDRPTAAEATAELANLLAASKHPQHAAVCYDRLRREFSDVVCREEKTGAQILATLPDDGPVKQALQAEQLWPLGKVEVQKSASMLSKGHPLGRQGVGSTAVGRYALEYCGDRGPFFADCTIRFDHTRSLILAQDGLGRPFWKPVSLVKGDSRHGEQPVYFGRGVAEGRVCGHVLLLSMGPRIVAVNTLGTTESGQPKVLWSVDLSHTDPFVGCDDEAEVQNNAMPLPQLRTSRYYSREMGSLGPVSSQRVVFQCYRNLVAADPLTGTTLWVRRNVAPGSKLFGDDHFLFALPPGKSEAVVFRATDGQKLGKRKIPTFEPVSFDIGGVQWNLLAGMRPPIPAGALTGMFVQLEQTCLATLGRQLLLWHKDGDHSVLELFDPWQQRRPWPPRKFSSDARASVVGHEAVGVFEPDGSFTLVSLPEGRTIAQMQLQAEPKLSDLCVLRLGRQYFAVTSSRPDEAVVPVFNRMLPQPMPGASYKAIHNGRVYAFDLAGKPIWPEPVTIEDQHLLLNQPGRLPVLTFACQPYQQKENTSGSYKASILCIDKRTGQKIYEDTGSTNATSFFAITADPTKSTVTFRTIRETVTLTFTDEPIPPPSDAKNQTGKNPAPSSGERTARALFRVLGKAAIATPTKPPRPTFKASGVPAAPPPATPPPR